FALDAGDVALVARQLGLHFGHAVQVLLVVAAFAALLFGLALVVFLLQDFLARLRLAQLGLQHRAGLAVARALGGVVDARAAGRCPRGAAAGRRRRGGG